MDKGIDVRWIGWVVVLLPYEIGLLFMLFGSATLVQVVFFGTFSYLVILGVIVLSSAILKMSYCF